MMNKVNIKRTPLYFGEQNCSIFGWYHAPKSKHPHLAMVICPPIGNEYVRTHRCLRHLADDLARAGIACLRFDYHGTGDSTGVDEDPLRVPTWLENIKQAILQIKLLTGCDEVGLIGFRIGATLATLIAENNDLACLVLWAPCIRGRNYIREMKALRMAGMNTPQDKNNKDIESAGFVLTEQTIDDLNKIDLYNVIPATKKILVVMRDDLSEESQRLDQWKEHGIHSDYLKFADYDDIVAPQEITKIPSDTITQIRNWITLSAHPSIAHENSTDVTPYFNRSITIPQSILVETTEHEKQNIVGIFTDILESTYQFGEDKHLFGVLCEPLSDTWKNRPTVVLTNSGAAHHVGQSRLYVLLARNIARSGFRCLRMDLSGLGDSYIEDSSKENNAYVSSSSADIDEALKSLQLNETTFVVMGLCSGAHAAFHVAMDSISQPIDECILINPLTFYWKEGMSLSTTASLDLDKKWHYYKNTIHQKERWIKLIRGEADILAIINTIRERVIKISKVRLRAILRSFKLIGPIPDDLNDDLQHICSMGTKISFIFSTTDPGYETLISNAKGAVKRLSKINYLNIQFIKDANHTFQTSSHRIELTNKLIIHLIKRYS